jgi:hypothetical protein
MLVVRGIREEWSAAGPCAVHGPTAAASHCEEHLMLRTLLCAVLALFLCAGLAEAAKKKGKRGKRGTNYHGKIVKVDADGGTLTVAVKKKKSKETEEKEFKVNDKTPVEAISADGEKTELTGKDVLKKEQFKEGAQVTVTCDKEGNVTKITFGKKAKKSKGGKKKKKNTDS